MKGYKPNTTISFLVVFAVVFAVVFTVLFAGYTTETAPKEEDTKTITDVLGRAVEIPKTSTRILAMGPGALRMVCYMEGADFVVGIEEMEKEPKLTRAYSYVNQTLKELPVVGQGGSGGNVPFEEEMIKVAPDVIIAAYDEKMAADVERKTGIPVVTVQYDGIFDEDMDTSLKIIGEVIGNQKRATELIAYMDGLEEDLHNRTKDIKEEEKPSVYTGGVNFRGAHGFEGTYGEYPPFVAINGKNVVDETGQKGSMLVDLEKVLVWNPDIIFLNPENFHLIHEHYAKEPSYYEALDGVKNGKVYAQISYNWYTTNVEIAIADAYYAGKIIYPNEFLDIKPEEKADEIFEMMLGQPLYDEFAKRNLGFGELKIGA